MVTHGNGDNGVTVQPSSRDDHVRAEEETAAGRNVQAQRRGEEASRCAWIRKAGPVPPSPQRGAPHMTLQLLSICVAKALGFAL